MDLKDVLTGAESIVGAEVKERILSLNRGLGQASGVTGGGGDMGWR